MVIRRQNRRDKNGRTLGHRMASDVRVLGVAGVAGSSSVCLCKGYRRTLATFCGSLRGHPPHFAVGARITRMQKVLGYQGNYILGA